MGGDAYSISDSSIDDENLHTFNPQFLDSLSKIPSSGPGALSGNITEENDSEFTESDVESFPNSHNTVERKSIERKNQSFYAQVLKNYDDLKHRAVNMEVAKNKILSYVPGSWVENVGGKTVYDYDLPKTTTLLFIGPKGSGKSSLINRISRVFEDDKFAPERAQVTYNSSIGNGTFFLQEYMIPRNSTSFCVYDTPSFSNNSSENLEMIKNWMTKGVCHNELVKSSSLHAKMNRPKDKLVSYEKRTVNFVIFVVNALSVLKSMESDGTDTQYTEMVAEVFNSPSLSFKDHEPAIAITHGDVLTLSERARVRVYLGELLGIHPCKQTFDIPDNNKPTTELTIVDLVRYALEHADRNLPCKSQPLITKGRSIQIWACLLLVLSILTVHFHGSRFFKVHVESVSEPCLEIKKVNSETVCEPCLEIKEVEPERSSELSLERKEVDRERIVEPSLPKKKVGKGKNFEPKLERKKVGKGREATVEVDWKTIRHVW